MLELDIGHASMKDARSPSCATRPASLCNIFHVQLKKEVVSHRASAGEAGPCSEKDQAHQECACYSPTSIGVFPVQ